MLHQLQHFGVLPEEIPADIITGFHDIFLVLAIHDLIHTLDEQTGSVGGQQRIPVIPPDYLDHIPAGAPEDGLQFLDDLAIATDGAVQALEIAVDYEDEVVQGLARR